MRCCAPHRGAILALSDTIRARLLRWDGVLRLAAVLLPFGVAMGLGFLWLIQNGWFLWFVVASVTFGGFVWAIRWIAARLRRARPAPAASETETEEPQVAPDPDWSPGDRRAFAAARVLIRDRTVAPVEWPQMQALALEVIETVAAHSDADGRPKTALDFTAPEMLLLVERVAARFRGDLRRLVPFSDRLRLATLQWMWRHRGHAARAAQMGEGAWRLLRLARNPPVAVMQEIDRLLVSGHSGRLSSEAMAVAQAILLEEVAKAAVDLYSGRLRFSEAELMALRQADSGADGLRMARPDAPVRIVVAGQVSAGKSTLVNALQDADRAETDAQPTTEAAAAHDVLLGDVPARVIDLPGLDGSAEVATRVLAELDRADMVLWLHRATRPGRAIDARALAAWEDARPGARRAAPVVHVMSCADTLLPDWPYPEHAMPRAAAARIGEAVRAVAAELDIPLPIPLCAEPPVWNLDMVEEAMEDALPEALMVQRNRVRVAGGEAGAVRTELHRGVTGAVQGVRGIGRRWLERRGGKDGDDAG